MKVNPTKNIRYIITNLKPYTQYAYFVKTLTMTDYHIHMDAYSKIQYFRTLPSKPGPVRRIYYTAIAMDKIVCRIKYGIALVTYNGLILHLMFYKGLTLVATTQSEWHYRKVHN